MKTMTIRHGTWDYPVLSNRWLMFIALAALVMFTLLSVNPFTKYGPEPVVFQSERPTVDVANVAGVFHMSEVIPFYELNQAEMPGTIILDQ